LCTGWGGGGWIAGGGTVNRTENLKLIRSFVPLAFTAAPSAHAHTRSRTHAPCLHVRTCISVTPTRTLFTSTYVYQRHPDTHPLYIYVRVSASPRHAPSLHLRTCISVTPTRFGSQATIIRGAPQVTGSVLHLKSYHISHKKHPACQSVANHMHPNTTLTTATVHSHSDCALKRRDTDPVSVQSHG
jgi:hypothetical protein